MKLALLIPDRGDRPKFLENCFRMIAAQTLAPTHIELVNHTPLSPACDITYRYRTGYDSLRNKGFDLIAFIENDDWYSPNYLQVMCNYWIENRPNIIGIGSTNYYHIKERKHFTFTHPDRSSMFCTLIKPDLDIDWGNDTNPYTDTHLWKQLKGELINPVHQIAIGIKHGEGFCGGIAHTNSMSRYIYADPQFAWLKQHIDQPSFNFYSTYFND